MKIRLVFFILFVYANFSAQQINILSVEKIEDGMILNCELVNNTNKEIVLPIQFDDYYNRYSNFFNIETIPKEIFYTLDYPPFPMSFKFPKLKKENLLVCPSNSSLKFLISTKKITSEGLRMISSVKMKKIRIVYDPFPIDDKEEYLEEEIKDIVFYDKKIKSKYFNLKKAK